MNLRTFEIIANWISKEMKVNIEFHPDICPCASLETNTIKLPNNIKSDNSLGALSTLMHEAAHLNYTKRDITKEVREQVAPGKQSHQMLNVLEDIRIDRKNFRKLPNISRFYKEGAEIDKKHRKTIDLTKVPLHKKVLINSIYELEGLSTYKLEDAEVQAFSDKHSIVLKVWEGVEAIEGKNWDRVEEIIKELLGIFGIQDEPRDKGGGGAGKIGEGNGDLDLSELKGNPCECSGQGTEAGSGFGELGSVAITEITKQKFKELLNIKKTRFIEDGNKVNTDNLTAFFTGDVNELFEEEKIERKKKSKIMMVMDASGSMNSSLQFDSTRRNTVVAGCVQEIATCLDELQNTEGLNVDYDIAGFNCNYSLLNKNTWREDYLRMGGGTDLLNAFTLAQEALLKEQEVDGNRLIVLFTDGDVSSREIVEMKQRIIQHGQDVRCMIIGVGADIAGTLVKEIIGDFNIVSKECADVILMEAIMTMLD